MAPPRPTRPRTRPPGPPSPGSPGPLPAAPGAPGPGLGDPPGGAGRGSSDLEAPDTRPAPPPLAPHHLEGGGAPPAPGAGPLARASDASPARLYLARFHKAHSRRAMESSLRALLLTMGVDPAGALDFPWHALDYEAATRLRTALATRYKARSAARHVAALVGVLRVATRTGLYDERRLAELMEKGGPLHAPAIDTPPAGRMLTPVEVLKVIDAARSRRDMAILALAAFTGLRRFEISQLDLTDLDFDGAQLKVRGKGDKIRVMPIPDGARGRLEEYVSERGRRPGPLFYRVGRSGRMIAERLSDAGVYDVIIAACRTLQARATPHDFRRTFASTLLDTGTDIVTVRDLMGHANVETTARYDRRGDQRKKRAAAVLDEVFRRPTS